MWEVQLLAMHGKSQIFYNDKKKFFCLEYLYKCATGLVLFIGQFKENLAHRL